MLVVVGAALLVCGIAVAIAYGTKGSSGPAGDVQVRTVDFRVLMPTTIGAGRHTIGVTNDGKVPHEFVLFQTALPADRLPLGADGDVNEDSPALTSVADSGASVPPGGTTTVKTSSLAPGHYVAVCNLPGHYRLGMHIDVTVR
jgi:hypothetical protein